MTVCPLVPSPRKEGRGGVFVCVCVCGGGGGRADITKFVRLL